MLSDKLGRYIARRLIAENHEVLTLTNSPERGNPFGDKIRVAPFNFDLPERLAKSLRGMDALINTYWVRFDHKLFTHAQAVANTRALFAAAKQAGVRRIVHVSITNPTCSPAALFSGQGGVGKCLAAFGNLILHFASDGLVRQGGRADQQHRVGIAPLSGLRRFRRWRLPAATDLCG